LPYRQNELPRSRADGVSTANRKKGNAASCGEFTQIDLTIAVGADGGASDATGIDGNQDNNNAIDYGAV